MTDLSPLRSDAYLKRVDDEHREDPLGEAEEKPFERETNGRAFQYIFGAFAPL